MAGENPSGPHEAFTAFWTDFMQRMTGAGSPPAAAPQQQMFEQARRAFFDAWAQYLDGYMRSEAFLQAMKQSMDNALSMQQTINDALQKGLSSAQMPSSKDADHVVMLIRGMEERLAEKMDKLAARVEKLEKSRPATGAKRAAKPARKG